MKKLIIVADWAKDSLPRQEVRTAVEGFLKDPEGVNINYVSTTPSTIHTAFILSQIVETEERFGRPRETVIFQNTDPRLQSETSLKRADGAAPVVILLKSGLYLTGPNAGYDFSMIKDKIEELFIYKGENEEGQFHSRDLYGRMSAHLMDSMEDEMEMDELKLSEIPELDGNYVAHVDNFGNIKTTMFLDSLKGKYEYGDMVPVTINGVTKNAKFVTNLFGGHVGELVIYPGSSGMKNNRYLEVTIWRHFTEKNPTTGRDEFKNPRPGMEIKIGKA